MIGRADPAAAPDGAPARLAAPGDPRRGAALLIVLMFAVLLASLAGAAMRTGVSGARAAAVFADAARADALGQAAGDIVIFSLITGDAAARRGGSLAVSLPDAEIAIDYVSESARIDANTASVPLISALLSVAGTEPQAITAAMARIAVLRAPSSEPKPPALDPTSPTPPANAPPAAQFTSSVQAVEAWGLPPDVAGRLLPSLTVASGSKGVDPLLADRFVLAALLDGDDTRVDDYIERRNQGFVNSDSATALLPIPSRPFADFEDVPAVRAIARVTVARRFTRRYEMVVAAATGSPRPPVVTDWRKLL